MLYRVALVLQCCIVDRKLGTGFVQTLQKLEQTEELTEVEALMRRALLACEKSCIKPVESKLYHRELKNILRDNSVIDEVLHYLICCGEKFHEINKVPSNEIQVIKSMFENYSITKNVLEKQEVSAEQQITEIMKVIEKIFDDLFYRQGK